MCQKEVEDITRLTEKSKEMYGLKNNGKKRKSTFSLLMITMGLAFLFYGFYDLIRYNLGFYFRFDIFIGFIFTAFGTYELLRKDRLNY